MTDYLIYPEIDGDHSFPPEVNQAIADSPEVQAEISGAVTPKLDSSAATATYAQKVSSTGGVKVLGDQGLNTFQFRGSNPNSGAPTTGTYAFNDVVRDVTGQAWVCITGGTPGVWNPANPGFIAQLPQAFNDVFTKMNAGGSVTFSATPFTLTVISTTGFPSTGKILVGTGVPGGTVPIRQLVSYTGTTGTTFTGCTIVGADVVVPDGQDVFYGKSDLRGGTLTVGNQIIANSAVDGRPHDLVLLAAFDPSSGHTYGDYDVIISREAGSFGTLQIDIPMRATQDISFGDSLNNKLMIIAGGNNRTADQGAAIIPAQSIAFAGTLVGDQGATKSLVFKNRQSDSQIIFNKSDGTTKLFYIQDAGPTVPNQGLLMWASNGGSGFAYMTLTSGNNLSTTVGAGGARWMNNAFTTQILTLTNTGSLVMGPTIAANAVDGFPYIPAVAGVPTGVPTAQSGHAPMYYDTTNHKLWIYDGGWKGVVLS